MKHKAYSDAEIVLSAISDPSRSVVELYRANVDSITRAEVQASAEGPCQARFGLGGILETWRRKNGDTKVVTEIKFIPDTRGANSVGPKSSPGLRQL